ncbi:MAG TPA: endonuclease/exonuclease/phosphatase family protein [Vicinamibacterales bacterium]|nr:endonuclease/exonuclease/phosphatase family protein [Vicinamibacterales bacterium]
MAARVIATLAAVLTAAGCASHVRMAPEPALPVCRTTTPAGARAVRWISPYDADDRKELRAWCDPVGPIVRHDPGSARAPSAGPLVVVTWNMAVGDGRLVELVADVRGQARGVEPAIVLLLQEAYRRGDVPAQCPTGSGVAGRLGSPRGPDSPDILELARTLAMYAVYVPSMRNGRDCSEQPREDRGNAILSTLPLDDVLAIEMPFAQQRRVAVAAIVRHGAGVRVASVHFDTLRGHGRHALALRDVVESMAGPEPVVIGGDFNAHLFDSGVAEMRKHFAEIECAGGATHAIGRLDRLFTRGLRGASTCERGSDSFGSDHYPLIFRFSF